MESQEIIENVEYFQCRKIEAYIRAPVLLNF